MTLLHLFIHWRKSKNLNWEFPCPKTLWLPLLRLDNDCVWDILFEGSTLGSLEVEEVSKQSGLIFLLGLQVEQLFYLSLVQLIVLLPQLVLCNSFFWYHVPSFEVNVELEVWLMIVSLDLNSLLLDWGVLLVWVDLLIVLTSVIRQLSFTETLVFALVNWVTL